MSNTYSIRMTQYTKKEGREGGREEGRTGGWKEGRTDRRKEGIYLPDQKKYKDGRTHKTIPLRGVTSKIQNVGTLQQR